MKTFNKEIEDIGKLFNSPPIYDGIVNEEKYIGSEVKLMWVLKDANSTGESETYDLRKAINSLKRDYGVRKGWEKTFNNIIYVTNGILKNTEWENIPYPRDKPDIVDVLQNIAYINVKKIGGGAKSNDLEVNEHYQKNKELLLEQIDEFNPDVIIFGNTYHYFKDDLKLNQMNVFGTCHATAKDNRIYLSAYHPNARMKQKDYFDDIMIAYHAFKKVSLHLYSNKNFQKDMLTLNTELSVLMRTIEHMESKLINIQRFEKAAEIGVLKKKVLATINDAKQIES
jgi:hypothetical protein